jgi:hypothetical protein
MGSCLSTHSRTKHINPVPYPSPHATPQTTHIVAVKVPHIRILWYFDFRLNPEPVVIGQQVALYQRAMDSPEPDPDETIPDINGWIDTTTGCAPNAVTFSIINGAGERIAQLYCPGYTHPPPLNVHSHPTNPAHPAMKCDTPRHADQ